jgi:hypothetical protein
MHNERGVLVHPHVREVHYALLLLNVLAVQQTKLDLPIAGGWHLAG